LVSRTELAEIGVRLASNIKAWRLERGMTQKDIAEHLGVSYVMIYKFEKGKVRIPIQRMIQFSRALQLPIAALLVGVSRELDDAARLADPATVRLVRAFDKVHDATTRESIVEGVELIVARKGTDNAASRRSRGGRTRRRSNQRT
jgi:transcriptional regulator with XRE-family HTH domain